MSVVAPNIDMSVDPHIKPFLDELVELVAEGFREDRQR